MGEWILRDYRSEDCDAIIDLFRNTVHRINIADYTTTQVEAWAPDHIDAEAWDASLQSHIALVAEIDVDATDRIVGFADMTLDGYLDRLYVHADYQRQGIALTNFVMAKNRREHSRLC